MAELRPITLSTLLKRIYHEYTSSGAIFDLPKRKFYVPTGSVDMSVVSCGNRAANPAGPAAGPHTQLAQNIVLSWLAGARIIELKTVQINDRLDLARPCIDCATVGYNTEWSQELRLEESAREYVKAGMIVEILKQWLFYSGRLTACAAEDGDLLTHDSPGSGTPTPVPHTMNLDTIFDVSVGYDLAGISSAPIRNWLSTMLDASDIIEELREEIPAEFASYRGLPFRKTISDSITLSTFHGTPTGEIERICEFLLETMGFHVVVKMNPPMLGKARLEHLLHDTLGYTNIEVNPKAYDATIAFDDAAAMVKRLEAVAARNKKTIGVKFGNTLEVINRGSFLNGDVQYLSGQPLHVLHLALVDRWRTVFGPEFPISFSAGVDALNFPDCVAIGLVPTTTCTDLLRPGGYGRLQQYLVNLEKRMKAVGASTIDEFIIRSDASALSPNASALSPNTAALAADGGAAASNASALSPNAAALAADGGAAASDASALSPNAAALATDAGVAASDRLRAAIMNNSSALLERSIGNPRYRCANNSTAPRKVGSRLSLWDCLNCDKCIPVCPNDANFFFEVEPVSISAATLEITRSGWTASDGGVFTIGKRHQIGNYADACNECGNCDVFCPEDGGPYIEKPRFFGSLESYRTQETLDGFVLMNGTRHITLFGRFAAKEYELTLDSVTNEASFATRNACVTLEWTTHAIRNTVLNRDGAPEQVDMRYYFSMAALLKGLISTAHINFVTTVLNHG
jgi:putative selenate reductase